MIKVIMHELDDLARHMRLQTKLLFLLIFLMMFFIGFSIMSRAKEKGRIINVVSAVIDNTYIDSE